MTNSPADRHGGGAMPAEYQVQDQSTRSPRPEAGMPAAGVLRSRATSSPPSTAAPVTCTADAGDADQGPPPGRRWR